MKILLLLLACWTGVARVWGQSVAFSNDSAYAVLQVIAGDIGPRPMGSPAEQRALAYAASMFARYGCDTSFVMPVRVAQGINTSSGVAVGVKRGSTGRIIVIGGHIDSAGPEIPGACDDGSGSACVIECARVLNSRPHASTLVYCCFGGEEDGLRGSRFFVEHFPLIDSVALMLQVDMADGAGPLEAYVDGSHQISAPRWLVSAAFEVFYNELHDHDLSYHTHFSSINSSGEGATGSDHEPFLKRGIPAAAFVSDVSHPIHTAQDDLGHFTRAGLKRSGDLIIGIAERFDGGVPSRSTETYYLVQFGSVPVFLSHTVLWGFVAAAVVLSLVALWVARARRLRLEPRVRWSGLKMFLVVLIIQTALWSSESLVGMLNGVKFAWVGRFGWFLSLALASAVTAIWLTTILARRIRLTGESFGFYLKAVILLLVLLLPLSALNPELALYPAWGLFWIGAAIVVRKAWLKLLFVLVSPYYMLRAVFLEDLGLIQRMLAQIPLGGVGERFAYNAAYVVVFGVLSLPFAWAFAGIYRETGVDYVWLKRWRFRWLGAIAAVAVVLLAGMLTVKGAGYDDSWRREIRANQRYTYGADSSDLQIRSSEFLTGTVLSIEGRDTAIAGRTLTYGPRRLPPVKWLTVTTGEVHDLSGPVDTVTRTLDLSSGRRPLRVSLSYRSQGAFTLTTPYGTGSRSEFNPDTPRKKTLEWYSYPPEELPVSVTLELAKGQKVEEDLEVIYDQTAVPVAATGAWISLTARSTVTRKDTVVGR